jgi:hypothetical protein
MLTRDVPSSADVDKLVRDVYTREYHAIINTHWPSGVDERTVLKAAQDCRDLAQQLLAQEQQDHSRMTAMSAEKRRVAQEYWGYVRTSLWSSSTAIRNMQVRREYISSLQQQAAKFRKMLDAAQKADEQEELARLARTVQKMELEVYYARLNTSTESFSRLLHAKDMTFDRVLEKFARKSFGANFADLADEQKAAVYASIIDASGRSGKVSDLLTKARGVAGIATILFMLATAAWDIAEADHPVEEAIKDMWVSGSALAAGFTAETLAGAVTTALAAELTETAAAVIGLIGGFLGGALAGMAAAAAAGTLFDLLLDAFRLRIPDVLKTRMSVPLVVPMRSPLSTYMAAKLTP